jgi:hypothetical protein
MVFSVRRWFNKNVSIVLLSCLKEHIFITYQSLDAASKVTTSNATALPATGATGTTSFEGVWDREPILPLLF